MDIQKNLGMTDATIFRSSFNRPNLYYELRPKHNIDHDIIRFIKQHEGKSGIIYCLSRKKVEELAELLDHSRGEVPVEIKASGKWQTISVAAEDSAGNQSSGLLCANNDSEITGYRLLVSSNILVHLYRSGILPAAALLALAAVFWLKQKWIQMFTKIL
jgi:hypothetical protein